MLGPRGTGKTSLLNQEFDSQPNVFRIDLLRGGAYQRYLADPELFRKEAVNKLPSSGRLTVIVDEIQRIPELLNEVHSLIEEFKDKIRFVLTGSSARKLKRGGANLLAGRAIVRHLYPLSSFELTLDLTTALQIGILPSVYLNEDVAQETLDSYVSTYLREEISEELRLRRAETFARFLEVAGQLNGEPVNFSKIARQLRVSSKPVQEYFLILTDTLICERLDGWAHSVKKQLLQAPKFYFFDTGVLNSINGELRSELKPSSFRFGRLFETFLIQEIIRLNSYCNLGLRFNYWRDKEGREVDLILSRSTAKPLAAIEIKSTEKLSEDDLAGLKEFQKEYPKVPLYILSRTSNAYEVEGAQVFPWREGLLFLKERFSKASAR